MRHYTITLIQELCHGSQSQVVKMEMCVWLMEMPQQEEWKFVLAVCGVMYVMTTGMSMMLGSFAGNLDYQQNVRDTVEFFFPTPTVSINM